MTVQVKFKQDTNVALKQAQDKVLQEKVDRLFYLQKEINAVAPTVAEFEALKKELLAEADQLVGAGETKDFKGTDCVVAISARAKKREVTDITKVSKMLGNKTFMALASVTLGDLDKYLTPPELAEVVSESQTGARKLVIKPL